MAKTKNVNKSDISDPVPGFENVSISRLQEDLNSEFTSLDGGYYAAKTQRIIDYREYAFKKYGNEQKGRSQVVDSTIFNVVEWMLPTLIRPFVESDEVAKVLPEDPESLVSAGVLRELLTHQLKKRENYYQLHYDMIKTMLVARQSYSKVTWYEPEKNSHEKVGRPMVTPVHPDSIRYDWSATGFYNSHVVTHEEDMTKSDILSLMGNAKGVIRETFDKIMEENGSELKTSRLRDEQQEYRGWVGNEAVQPSESMGLFLRREHWTKYDMKGDGTNVQIMAVFLNDALVQVIENPFKFKKPPFTYAQGIRDPFSANAWSLAEALSDIQKFKTGIMRAFSDNLASQANGMYEVDTTHTDSVAMELIRRSVPGTSIPVTKPGSVNALSPSPIAGQTFNIWELMEVAGENRGGFTRFSQGLNSSSLNQTATGFVGITQRSEMRVWEYAARYTETFLKPTLRMVIAMNQQFLKPQALQIQFGEDAGSWVDIKREDIGGYVNIEVDLQIGSDKQQQIENISQALQFASPYLNQGIPPEVIGVLFTALTNNMNLPQVQTLMRSQYVGRNGVTVPRSAIPGGEGAIGATNDGREGQISPGNAETTGIPDIPGIDIGALLGEAAG